MCQLKEFLFSSGMHYYTCYFLDFIVTNGKRKCLEFFVNIICFYCKYIFVREHYIPCGYYCIEGIIV